MTTRDALPQKVTLGTAMYAMWGEYPGIEKRLDALSRCAEGMGRKEGSEEASRVSSRIER
jgi:hypothetical protein